MQITSALTGGRPMTKLGEAFEASDGAPVYLWKDRNGQQFLAEGAWSLCRLNAPFDKNIYLNIDNVAHIKGCNHTPEAVEFLRKEARERYDALTGHRTKFRAVVLFACLAYVGATVFFGQKVSTGNPFFTGTKR